MLFNVNYAEQLCNAVTVYVSRCVNFLPVFPVMARPQVADGGTASDMEGSCE